MEFTLELDGERLLHLAEKMFLLLCEMEQALPSRGAPYGTPELGARTPVLPGF